jgi:hypothetical protein
VNDLPLIVEEFFLWYVLPNTDFMPVRVSTRSFLRLLDIGFVSLFNSDTDGGLLLYVSW